MHTHTVATRHTSGAQNAKKTKRHGITPHHLERLEGLYEALSVLQRCERTERTAARGIKYCIVAQQRALAAAADGSISEYKLIETLQRVESCEVRLVAFLEDNAGRIAGRDIPEIQRCAHFQEAA